MQQVPQYIDVEDKVVGPLTWKHLGWFFVGGALMVLAYLIFDKMTFFIIAFFIAVITVAFAFYKPNGMTLIEFAGYGFTYLFNPKVYTWEREVKEKRVKKNENEEIKVVSATKEITSDEIELLAKTLDSEGKERNEKIQEIIKKHSK